MKGNDRRIGKRRVAVIGAAILIATWMLWGQDVMFGTLLGYSLTEFVGIRK